MRRLGASAEPDPARTTALMTGVSLALSTAGIGIGAYWGAKTSPWQAAGGALLGGLVAGVLCQAVCAAVYS